MIELTQEQSRELSGSETVAIDPNSKEQYILVRKDVFERMKGLLDDDARIMYPLLANLDPEDWEDVSVYHDIP
ncbi:MAG: hypothetical protein L0Y72_26845 [Gemmataceae bacterium]|nr:hypothetical protein [Gemmataceae bacterium]